MAPAKRKRADVSKKATPTKKTPTVNPPVTRSKAAAGGFTPNPNAAAVDPAPAVTTPRKSIRASAKTPSKGTPAAVVAKTPESAEKKKSPAAKKKTPAVTNPGKKTRVSARTPANATATPVAVAAKTPESAEKKKTPAAKKKLTPAAESLSQKSSGSAAATSSRKGRKDKTAPSVIIIEACKQCQSFKRTAEAVKKGLEEGLGGVVVNINPEKPRKGCFEVRDEDGEVFVSLLNMPRPFKRMKELDLEEVVADIVGKKK